MPVTPARRAALAALARVRTRSAWGHETLDAVLEGSDLGPKDRALATRLAYGVMETEGVLDEALARHLAKPGGVEPLVRDALRLGAYELLFARTPPRAAVNEAVEAVRRARPQAAGLANAVLRRLAQEADAFPWGDPEQDVAALARATGHPRWIADLFVTDLGRREGAAALRAGLEPAPLYLWHNPFWGGYEAALSRLAAEGVQPEPGEPRGCVRAGVPSAVVRSGALAEGLVVVADAAAQIAAIASAPSPGAIVVDLAAGRGTKTAQLQAEAVRAGGAATIHAVDVHSFKLGVLEARMRSLGVPGVTVHAGDATRVASIAGLPSPGTVDVVLVDAPCSGLGTLRRRPDKRWRLDEGSLDVLVGVQAAMLGEAASLVRPGGVVVYSTCSLARREGRDVVTGFLSSTAGERYAVEDMRGVVPPAWAKWVGPEGYLQSIPEPGGPDGHFVARLRRVG